MNTDIEVLKSFGFKESTKKPSLWYLNKVKYLIFVDFRENKREIFIQTDLPNKEKILEKYEKDLEILNLQSINKSQKVLEGKKYFGYIWKEYDEMKLKTLGFHSSKGNFYRDMKHYKEVVSFTDGDYILNIEGEPEDLLEAYGGAENRLIYNGLVDKKHDTHTMMSRSNPQSLESFYQKYGKHMEPKAKEIIKEEVKEINENEGNEMIHCPCGGNYNKKYKWQHFATKQHKTYENSKK